MNHSPSSRPARPLRRAAWTAAAALALAVLSCASHAELPVEQLTMEKLQPIDPYRIYISDPALGHLVDGRTHIVDGGRMRYLGLLGTGFSGLTAVSPDHKTLYVATTYYSRLQRGTRTDVVEAYNAEDLSFQYEVEIPPKHVQGLPMRALIATTADNRFLLVQNATPATSVTVVDLQARKVVAEIATPGCYGVLPWPEQPRRFSAVCGDGTLATVDLDAQGAQAGTSTTEPFFNPDKDPVFMHYEMTGSTVHFISYLGVVHSLTLAGDKPVASRPWSFVDATAAKAGWSPGGYQLFAIEPRSQRLFVGMHDKGVEGSHKNPAKEIWVIDLKSQKRVARAPGQAAVSMNIARTEKPQLFVLSGADNRILSFDVADGKAPTRALRRSEPFGEMPIYLGLNP